MPLFALANAGIHVSGALSLARVRLAGHAGDRGRLVVGKPVGISARRWLATRLGLRGRLRPPVGWAAVLGGGAVAGIGFTVSLLIATLAFRGGSSTRRSSAS